MAGRGGVRRDDECFTVSAYTRIREYQYLAKTGFIIVFFYQAGLRREAVTGNLKRRDTGVHNTRSLFITHVVCS